MSLKSGAFLLVIALLAAGCAQPPGTKYAVLGVEPGCTVKDFRIGDQFFDVTDADLTEIYVKHGSHLASGTINGKYFEKVIEIDANDERELYPYLGCDGPRIDAF